MDLIVIVCAWRHAKYSTVCHAAGVRCCWWNLPQYCPSPSPGPAAVPSTAQSSAHPGRLRTYTSSTVSNDQHPQQPCPSSRQWGCCVCCAGWGRSWRPRPRTLTTHSCCKSWSKSGKCQRPSDQARSVQCLFRSFYVNLGRPTSSTVKPYHARSS